MNKLLELKQKLDNIISDESMSWERKNHLIFLDGLKQEVEQKMLSMNMISSNPSDARNYDNANSCDESECLNFQKWMEERIKTA